MNILGIKNDASHVYAHRWWSFTVLSFSLLVISLDNTVLNVALPTLARDLAASTSQLQWIVDAYTLAFAGLLLTSGSLSDRFGRKRALLLGLLIFGSGSVWAAFSGSANVLIAARALMGIGGALIMPSTMSITTNTFPAKERAKAIGALTGVGGIGIILGPLLGGALPLGKAGVGSAVNDTTQEVGGALGVAVLGSILSSVYRSAIDHTASLQVLPPQLKTALRDSIGEATVISSQLGGHVGHIISSAANAAFINAMSQTVLIGAGVMLCSALITLLFLPARAKDEQASSVNRVSLTEQQMAATMEQQKEEEPLIS